MRPIFLVRGCPKNTVSTPRSSAFFGTKSSAFLGTPQLYKKCAPLSGVAQSVPKIVAALQAPGANQHDTLQNKGMEFYGGKQMCSLENKSNFATKKYISRACFENADLGNSTNM